MINIIWLIIILIVIYFVYRYLFKIPDPYIYRNIPIDDVGKYIQLLFKGGFDSGYIIINNCQNDYPFIQYKKYKDDNKEGLRLDFPLHTWSENYYPSFKKKLETHNINYNIININDHKYIKETLNIDFGDDVKLAIIVSKLVLFDVFNFDLNSFVNITEWNVIPYSL